MSGAGGSARRNVAGLAGAARRKAAGLATRRRAKVLVGEDGWLFLQNDSNDVIGQHTGRVSLSKRQRNDWSALIRGRMELAGECGCIWLCSIVPDKEAVYPEFLPPHVTPAQRRPVHDILDIAAGLRAPLTYPLKELRAAKNDPRAAMTGGLPVYSPTGTHWTKVGAFVVYEATCRALQDAGVDVSMLSWNAIGFRPFTEQGDLGEKLEPPRTGPNVRARVRQRGSRVVFDNRVIGHGMTMVFERDDGAGARAVVFGESFTNGLVIFLRESFRRLVFVWTSTMPREILEQERPDVVLSYPTERFLIRVPDDSSAFAQISETIRGKLERGQSLPKVGRARDARGAGEVRNDELPWSIPAEGPSPSDR
jgi:alginate O-acetyltransferase complex protein AlgJ